MWGRLEIQAILEIINIALTSGITIVSFALFLYLLIYNLNNDVARSFAVLLACVVITYFTDLALLGIYDPSVAASWLRFQWVGISFTPAVYLDFSNALLKTTGAYSRRRSLVVQASYLLSAVLLLSVTFSDIIVHGVSLTYHAPHLLPGPLFPLFVVYFAVAVIGGATNVLRARQRALTSTSRRRLTYLAAAFAAPAAGVFPYLLVIGWSLSPDRNLFWFLLVLGNIAIGGMLILLAYSVAFFGALTPDRVVKHRLIRFLLRGPLLATLVTLVTIAAARAEGWLGLPGGRLSLFGVVAVILLMQLGIEWAKPLIDRALYRQDQPEIARIQELSNRLLTTTDLRQFLENILTAVCDLLRVPAAFIAVIEDGVPRLEVTCGSLTVEATGLIPPETWQSAGPESSPGDEPPRGRLQRHDTLYVWDGYWLAPLRAGESGVVIGILGFTARSLEPDLSLEEQAGLDALLTQAVAALEDRRLQQVIFDALERIIPQIEDIQRRRGVVHYVGAEAISGFDLSTNAEFRQWVRDALSHYWGGPKFTHSPLMSLQVVEQASREHGGNVIQGLRTVLKEAIERLRPDGQREMTTPEWLLYNILELKFLQGYKVRDVARRLAMSESDLYRKQRIAIEAVAQTLAEMEADLSERAQMPDTTTAENKS